MKTIFYWILLLPFLVISQNTEYGVIENGLITANPTQIKQFEAGLAAHNKKFHSDEVYGARVYNINNGPRIGKYMWVMGPLPWSAFDSRPAKEGHDEDWNTNVLAYASSDGDQTYWKFEADVSSFSKDFTIKNLLVDIYDVKRGKMKDALNLVAKMKKVYAEKLPNEIYGIYTNQFPSTKEGRDLAVVSFYDKSAWLGNDVEISKKYDEVYGKGSFDQFLKDWYAVTDGGETELWNYRSDLSGISGEVKAATRQ